MLLIGVSLLLLVAGLPAASGGAGDCAAKWGFWLTSDAVELSAAQSACQAMELELVPLKVSDDRSEMNPVFRYMAGRIAERCQVSSFWVSWGLYVKGALIEDAEELRKTPASRQALCHRAHIEHPEFAPPAQTVFLTETLTASKTITRTFNLNIVLTKTAAPQVATFYATDETTVTVWTTRTFSVPTIITYRSLSWITETASEAVTDTVVTGLATTTVTKTLTATTSVIAVTRQELTTTVTTTCRDHIASFVTDIPASALLPAPSQAQDPPSVEVAQRQLICERFSDISEIKVCDSADYHAQSPLVYIATMVSFMDAYCVCDAMGLQLAELADEAALRTAQMMIRSCSDLPGQKVWVGRAGEKSGVCMAIGKDAKGSDPIACIQELPVLCE